MVLLDALGALASEFGLTLSAIHVHHGLSPNADAWAAFCERICRGYGVPLSVHRVEDQSLVRLQNVRGTLGFV